MDKNTNSDKPFKTTAKQHPLLAPVVDAVQANGGIYTFAKDRHAKLAARVKGIDHPAEAWMLAEDLIAFAYFLDRDKKSPQAASDVLDLAAILLPTLQSVVEAFKKGDDINWNKAKKIVATEQSNRPAAAAEGGVTGKGSLLSLMKEKAK